MRPVDWLCLAPAVDGGQLVPRMLPAFIDRRHRHDAELRKPLAPSLRAAERPMLFARLHQHPFWWVLIEPPHVGRHMQGFDLSSTTPLIGVPRPRRVRPSRGWLPWPIAGGIDAPAVRRSSEAVTVGVVGSNEREEFVR